MLEKYADGYDDIPKECSLVTATYSANGTKLGTLEFVSSFFFPPRMPPVVKNEVMESHLLSVAD